MKKIKDLLSASNYASLWQDCVIETCQQKDISLLDGNGFLDCPVNSGCGKDMENLFLMCDAFLSLLEDTPREPVIMAALSQMTVFFYG